MVGAGTKARAGRKGQQAMPIDSPTCGGLWSEYRSAAEWCARRGIKGAGGDPLPENLSHGCWALIDDDLDAFANEIRDCAYRQAMERAACGRED